jgi:nicotinate-nucleotide adenylyltransferase
MTARRRVGILGGTFDPIHCGHLDAGAAAQAALNLEELLLLPSNIPPHRPQPVASSYHRFAMVALAIAGRRGWRALDLELREDGRSYTSETLHRLHDHGFDAQELFFVTGADAFLEIATWKNYPAVLNLAHFAVVSRRGVPVGDLPARLPDLAERMRAITDVGLAHESDVGHAFQGVPEGSDAIRSDETVIFLIDASTADVSATAIRRARAHHEPIAGLVPPAVRQHIEQHALYEDVTAAAGAGGGS